MCLSSSERRRPRAVCTPSLNVSPFLSSLRPKLRPLRIYNSLQDCSSTRGCQTIQMRHHTSPFSGTLQATVFTVQSQRLTALGRLVGPWKEPPQSKQTPNKRGRWARWCAQTRTCVQSGGGEMHIWGTHLLPSYTTPMQPRGNKANTLFSPYVLLKRGLFDLKLIGQAWAQGLQARTAGLSTAAREMVEVGEESSSLFSPCIHLSIPRVQSIPLHLYPCFAAPIFYLSQPVSFRKLGRAQIPRVADCARER